MLKGHLEFSWRRCIVTPSRIRYGSIGVVLDSLPDQCAKDHTSTEMLVSHATYDQLKVLDFRVVQMWRRPMQLPAKKTPTIKQHCVETGNGRSRLIRPVACFCGCISRFSYMPPSGPSRSAWQSTARGWSETFRNAWNQPNNKRASLDGLLCLFPSDHGDARVGRLPEGDIATARPTRLSHHDKTTADSAPTRLALFIGRDGGKHNVVPGRAMVAVEA